MAEQYGVIIGIDPSSTKTGWSLMVNGVIYDAGEVHVKKRKQITPHRTTEIAQKLCSQLKRYSFSTLVMKGAGPPYRPGQVTKEIIIEYPSAKVYGNRPGTGLAIYGDAVGVVRSSLGNEFGGFEIHYVTPDTWCGGHSKVKRRMIAEKEWPTMADTKDSGGDIADAIALAVWFRDGGKSRCLAGG